MSENLALKKVETTYSFVQFDLHPTTCSSPTAKASSLNQILQASAEYLQILKPQINTAIMRHYIPLTSSWL